jgi:DNA replication protein DnaC
MSQVPSKIDTEILKINKVICRHIDAIETSERGYVAQDILAHLRNFIEHIMLKVWQHPNDIENTYPNICEAIKYVQTRGSLKFLRRFHDYLQIVASHYTLDEENSERLMLKYYEFLLKTKLFLQQRHGLEVLQNIEKFPINTDPGLRQYHEKIAEVLDNQHLAPKKTTRSDRYYLHKIKPFFINQKIYYEVTFTSTNVNASKFDRVIAFTDLELSGFYAAKLWLVEDHIEIMDRTMSILLITDWEVSIRPCEIDNFSRIFGVLTKIRSGDAEYKNLMRILTKTGFNLVEVIDFPDSRFSLFKEKIPGQRSDSKFLPVLERCRELSQKQAPGVNIIRYLLFTLKNKVIKKQLNRHEQNSLLSNLYLKYGCKPFDEIPFNTSPIYHNPKISDLFECISHEDREHELFARFIQNNTEIHGHIYTHIDECAKFEAPRELVKTYNNKLYYKHTGRVIYEFHNHFYIQEYQENTRYALHQLKGRTASGIQNYSSSVESWLNSNVHLVDCDEKKNALRLMFNSSQAALIYGPAGTGKSTLINHISHLFSQHDKLYLANTNPAIENLKRKVDTSNTRFYTIAKFLSNYEIPRSCDLLIIDECSTVSNNDIKDILTQTQFKLLVLVGDIFQIESIRFGNWFSAARSFIPSTSVFELTKPYRSDNAALLEFWRRVREQEDTILEIIARNGYSQKLDTSIFDREDEEEIILCLNYDGLYGINNINRFLQENNPASVFTWGVHNYKVDDPILFNESNRFAPLIYNNMKGKIVGIEILEDTNHIQFDIELDKAISGLDAGGYDFTLLDEDMSATNSVIRFTVNRYKTNDEDDDGSGLDVVPFQVAYAVSIHKAQGLEYNSVKIVITDETDELLTHNIFYTAITRAREKLRIFWSPEVEKKVLERFKTKKNNKDVALLKQSDPSLATP